MSAAPSGTKPSDGSAYEVLRNEKVGRYAVATRDLEPGAEVLTELPVAVGPKVDSMLCCLGCYAYNDGSTLCSRCGWPVCGPDCEAAAAHAQAECAEFSRAGVRLAPVEDPADSCPQLECILPLRALLAKERDPARWQREVAPMQAHNDRRRDTPGWHSNQVNVVSFLRDRCGLADRFDEELVHTVCGILEVNCFEVRCENGALVRGLYPQTAILSHNCIANTGHTIATRSETGEQHRLKLHVTVRVPAGGELFTSYTHSLDPTMVRREMLSRGKFFECCCERCKDPTELGTNLSTLKCSKCDNGVLLSADPLEPSAQWRCTRCEFCTRGEAVRRVLQLISNELQMVEAGDSVEARETLFRKYRSVLHPRHAYMSQMRHSLCQLYGRVDDYLLDDLPDVLLERKVDLCRDLLAVADVVEPGLSRLRGVVLYELHAPLMYLARHKEEFGEIDSKEMCRRMEEAAACLSEAAAILALEDASTNEAAMGRAAAAGLLQLRASLDHMRQQHAQRQ
ncbi:SET domain-containing protein SmydA-8 [Schistocerca americana]|uniref:SET domain-containing protein SmydA-8 n=1 Tax=Schistocerca americana TaxID=7009 RepID=UPI001F4FE30C|nr:SET domain-containing protein SmydA-8 [Schistocerca americana]